MQMSNSGLPPAQPRPKHRHIKHLELHVTHACNLACESCSHYSNHNHRGHMNLSDADRWMGDWSSRAFVEEFHLLGGEPTIHPELTHFIRIVRRHWPETIIRIRTNGFFLHRHPDLPELLATDKRAIVSLAVHHDSAEYRERLQATFDLIERWQKDFAIKVEVDQSFKNWTQRYKGFGADMQPFDDGAPRASWEICPARECMQLFEGKIWKCGPLAYLAMQNAKYGLSSKWDFYLGYKPLEPSCSDSEFDAFLAREDEPYCGMCSSRRRPLDLPNPIRRHRAQLSHSG
jgi:organic radical activating enzyme